MIKLAKRAKRAKGTCAGYTGGLTFELKSNDDVIGSRCQHSAPWLVIGLRCNVTFKRSASLPPQIKRKSLP